MNLRFARGTRAWLCALLALVLPFGGIAVAEAGDDPVAARVGDFSYTQSTLYKSLDSELELSEMLRDDSPSEEEKQARLQGTVDSFAGLGVIENKLAEAGKNDFTDAELEEMNQSVRSKYEELWQMLCQQMTEQGVHIIYCDSDVPAGAHVLTEGEQKLFNAAALRCYQLEKLNGLIEEWEADYDIETHPELLK